MTSRKRRWRAIAGLAKDGGQTPIRRMYYGGSEPSNRYAPTGSVARNQAKAFEQS